MKLNEVDRRQIQALLKPVEKHTSWIGQVFAANLLPVPADALIVSLGVGQNCEELIHLREFAGPKATIRAFDIHLPSPKGVLAILGTDTDFQIADIKHIDRITTSFYKSPALIVSRHPQIVQGADNFGNILSYNDWWLSCLTNWAKYALKNHSQMITTHYIIEEQERLNKYMQNAGLQPKTGTNQYFPRKFDQFLNARPDGFTLTFNGK